MSVLFTGGNTAVLCWAFLWQVADPATTAATSLPPPLFLPFTVLHLPTSFPFLSWNGFTAFLFSLPFLSYPILSHVFPFPFLFLAFSILSYPILSYPILLHLFLFRSYPILCIPSCFFAYPICSYLFASLLPILSYPILYCPVLCFRITYCFFAHPILSYPLASQFFISYVILSYAFAFLLVPLPILSFHIFASFFPVLSYILTSLFSLPFLFNPFYCGRIPSVSLHTLQFIPSLSILSAWILFSKLTS